MVIPAYNAEATLVRCLDSLSKQTVKPFQIILVDDCSTDRTASIASEAGLEILSPPARGGPAIARNAGAEKAEGDIILFLDSDVVVPPDLVERISEGFNADSSTVAVQTVYSPHCPAEDMVSRYQNFYYYHSLTSIKGNSTATFATWCAAIKRETFIDIGGFNTSIPEPTVEDEELGYEIADRGQKIVLERNIRVTHLASYTISQFIRRRHRMARAQAKSGWRSIRERLLKRYINLRETGTHHSRWVVLSILLVLCAVSLILVFLAGTFLRLSLLSWFPVAALVAILLSLLCHLNFFRSAVSHFGLKVLPGFLVLCLLDMTILGWGIIIGTVQFVSGKHY
ncbi:MAG: glycosyltransferase family 2 protein [Candidatus Aegiribacteria sp.]|nr:glycosyltransferase family 2 protein [Candidatus Aegiribacteria sp.]